VRYILGGSLVSVAVKAEGDLDDPTVSFLPPSAVVKGFWGGGACAQAPRTDLRRRRSLTGRSPPPMSGGGERPFRLLEGLQDVLRDLLRILVGYRFASKRVIPGPGFRIFPTMSLVDLTPWASRSFLWSVKAGLMIFPRSGDRRRSAVETASPPSIPSSPPHRGLRREGSDPRITQECRSSPRFHLALLCFVEWLQYLPAYLPTIAYLITSERRLGMVIVVPAIRVPSPGSNLPPGATKQLFSRRGLPNPYQAAFL